jgi:hypothetical protein
MVVDQFQISPPRAEMLPIGGLYCSNYSITGSTEGIVDEKGAMANRARKRFSDVWIASRARLVGAAGPLPVPAVDHFSSSFMSPPIRACEFYSGIGMLHSILHFKFH